MAFMRQTRRNLVLVALLVFGSACGGVTGALDAGEPHVAGDGGQAAPIDAGEPDGGGPADTTVATVTVTPGTVTLVPNATQQFEAIARNAANEALRCPALAWSHTGTGWIDPSGGLYTAGAENGSATVTATCEGVAGTAGVTVRTLPPLTPELCRHKPAGLTDRITDALDPAGPVLGTRSLGNAVLRSDSPYPAFPQYVRFHYRGMVVGEGGVGYWERTDGKTWPLGFFDGMRVAFWNPTTRSTTSLEVASSTATRLVMASSDQDMAAFDAIDGTSPGSAPGTINWGGGTTRAEVLYHCWVLELRPDDPVAGFEFIQGVGKFGWLGPASDGGNDFFYLMRAHPAFQAVPGQRSTQADMGMSTQGHGAAVTRMPSGGAFQTDRLMQLEVLKVINDVDVANGVYRSWLTYLDTGEIVPLLDRTDVVYFTASKVADLGYGFFPRFRYNPTWGGGWSYPITAGVGEFTITGYHHSYPGPPPEGSLINRYVQFSASGSAGDRSKVARQQGQTYFLEDATYDLTGKTSVLITKQHTDLVDIFHQHLAAASSKAGFE
jgi:hypothetical protein